MTIRHLATALVATLLWGLPASAQSAADLLQKGIYAQETMGDIDGAIRSYRQVLLSYPANKQIAAQAEYQLVLCMVQTGDRAGASREFDALSRNYPDQADLIAKARKLVPAGTELLPAAWPDGEAFQLNIKRDGGFTGEYLFYSTRQNRYHVRHEAATPNQAEMEWRLVTKRSTRKLDVVADRESMEPLAMPIMNTDDDTGDPAAALLAGPAIDQDPLIYRMRRLPLAVGYKTTVTTRPFVLGESAPRKVELTVTGKETVQVVAGKFNCYKVSAGDLGQIFWIGMDGARPLVKIQFAKEEAELVHVWEPDASESATSFLKAAGWDTATFYGHAKPPHDDISLNDRVNIAIESEEIYTAPSDITQALRQTMEDKVAELARLNFVTDVKVRPDSIQTRLIGGRQALICLIDYNSHLIDNGMPRTMENHAYYAWIRTEGLAVEYSYISPSRDNVALLRFLFEPVLATAKIP